MQLAEFALIKAWLAWKIVAAALAAPSIEFIECIEGSADTLENG